MSMTNMKSDITEEWTRNGQKGKEGKGRVEVTQIPRCCFEKIRYSWLDTAMPLKQ